MIITERFVMLNFPKTGSSFAREVVKQAHFHHPPSLRQRIAWRMGAPQRMLKDVLMKPNLFNAVHAAKAKEVAHGAYCQVPDEHRNKTIVTVVREPMARIISLYEFRAWAKDPRLDTVAVRASLPHFPEISFAEYFHLHMGLAYEASAPSGMRTRVGPLTLQFIRMYARDPMNTVLALHDGMDLRLEWRHHFPRIAFLRTERLNMELRRFLRREGYSAASLRFMSEKQRVNRSGRSQALYFTAEMAKEVRRRERFFFQLFPDYLSAHDHD